MSEGRVWCGGRGSGGEGRGVWGEKEGALKREKNGVGDKIGRVGVGKRVCWRGKVGVWRKSCG